MDRKKGYSEELTAGEMLIATMASLWAVGFCGLVVFGGIDVFCVVRGWL